MGIQWLGNIVDDMAVAAVPCADLAEDQKSRRSLLETFGDVGAACLLTDGVKMAVREDVPDMPEFPAVGQPDFQPFRFA
jgi:hypothetical protein